MQVIHIDDDPDEAGIVKHLLEAVEIETRHYLSIKQVPLETPASAALLDLSLRESSGLETIREFKKRFPGLPVVVLSGDEDKLMIDMAETLGVEYVKKTESFSIEKARLLLVERMQKAIDRKSDLYDAIILLETISKKLSENLP